MTCNGKHEGPWWLAASVRTNHEQSVAERIQETGAETYYPKSTRMVRPARKRKPMEIEEAAWPGYLLVRRDTIGDSESIFQCGEFHYFVQFNEYLAAVCQCMIDEIRSREALGAFQARFVSGPMFAIGETVKVPDGPWKSLKGKVTDMRRGRYELDGLDFPRPVWFSGLTLLGKSV